MNMDEVGKVLLCSPCKTSSFCFPWYLVADTNNDLTKSSPEPQGHECYTSANDLWSCEGTRLEEFNDWTTSVPIDHSTHKDSSTHQDDRSDWWESSGPDGRERLCTSVSCHAQCGTKWRQESQAQELCLVAHLTSSLGKEGKQCR